MARAPVTPVLTTRRRVPQTLGGSDGWSPAAAVAPKAPPTTILGNGNDPGRAEQSERDSAHQAEATSYRNVFLPLPQRNLHEAARGHGVRDGFKASK